MLLELQVRRASRVGLPFSPSQSNLTYRQVRGRFANRVFQPAKDDRAEAQGLARMLGEKSASEGRLNYVGVARRRSPPARAFGVDF